MIDPKRLFAAKLLVRIVLDKNGERYDTYENYTDLNEKTIRALGYIPARGYKEELRYFWTKVYVKLEGFKVHDCLSEKEPNLETSSTLHDYLQSDAQEQFMKAMGRISFAPLDSKKLILIGAIGLGAVLGFLILGGVI